MDDKDKTEAALALDEKIDVSLQHTFPASDPAPVSSNHTLEERLQRVREEAAASRGQVRRAQSKSKG